MNESDGKLTLAEIGRRMNRAGIAWAVFAGAAAVAYGATRPLTDVDILIPAAEGDRAADLFPEGKAKRRDDGTVRAIQLLGFDLVAGLAWEDADTGVACTFDLDSEMRIHRTYHSIEGASAPVIPPEDNLLIKALWRRGPEVGKHDWEDVQAMMEHLPEIDWHYLHWRAERCGGGPSVQQAVEDLERLARARRVAKED